MRKIVVNNFITLDGVIQAPGEPDEDTSGGFEYGGWTVHYWDAWMNQAMGEAMSRPFDFLLGRKTYEIFAAYWPASTEPGADQINNAKKYVASRTLKNVAWNNSTILNGDAAQAVKNLKTEDGPDLTVVGSGNLIQTLLSNNLVDEFLLFVFPVVIGKGKRLFEQGTIPEGLKLIESKASPNGVIMTTYVPAGELKLGSFAVQNAA